LVWAAAACSGAADAPPDVSDLVTRAEATAYRETSRYDDVMTFLRTLAERDPRVHLTSMGTTSEGRDMPLVVVGADGATPTAVRATGKLVVYLQGNIHGGEVPGKEALQMLLRDWVAGRTPDWTDRLVLLVNPIYNADGNEKVALDNRPLQYGPVGGMGQRPNAQGYDLNRDHMKLDTPEARAFVSLLNAYDPQVTLDLHTTDGTRHGYLLTYAPSLHPDTDPALDSLAREALLPDVRARILERYGWHAYDYGNAFQPRGAEERGWYTFDHRPRFNNNYVGLRNRLAILSEAYAYATFEDRVRATRQFVDEVLDWVHDHADQVRAAVQAAEARRVAGRALTTRSTFERSPEPVEILMGAVDTVPHPETGAPMLLRVDTLIPVRMPEFVRFRASETETAPAAYLLPGDLLEPLSLIEAHGLVTRRLTDDVRLEVERFTIDSTRAAERPFQGHNERTVWGRWSAVDTTLPRGTVVVETAQPLGKLAFHLLEPRADDGLVDWGLMDLYLRPGHAFPVLRTRSRVP
ncbi:MAG: peptidase M14, partial [Gemmatimonadetes bacterium]